MTSIPIGATYRLAYLLLSRVCISFYKEVRIGTSYSSDDIALISGSISAPALLSSVSQAANIDLDVGKAYRDPLKDKPPSDTVHRNP